MGLWQCERVSREDPSVVQEEPPPVMVCRLVLEVELHLFMVIICFSYRDLGGKLKECPDG